jgi:hypothetical protein
MSFSDEIAPYAYRHRSYGFVGVFNNRSISRGNVIALDKLSAIAGNSDGRFNVPSILGKKQVRICRNKYSTVYIDDKVYRLYRFCYDDSETTTVELFFMTAVGLDMLDDIPFYVITEVMQDCKSLSDFINMIDLITL